MKTWHKIALFLFIVAGILAYQYMNKQEQKQAAIAELDWTIPNDKFEVRLTKYTVSEYGNYEVIGEVKSISSKTYHFVQVEAQFYNSAGRIVGKDMAYACGEDYILPGGVKAVKFMGENQSDYKRVELSISSFSLVD